MAEEPRGYSPAAQQTVLTLAGKKRRIGVTMSEKENSRLIDSTIGVTATENIGRYGEAAAEYLKGYKGRVANDGEIIRKGLKQVADSKVNPEYRYQNIKQQAGFSAEIHYVNKENADAMIDRSDRRLYRSNDLGRGNDPVYDILSVDENGAPTWGAQMKFCGRFETREEIENSAKNVVNKLAGPKWEKYRGNKVLVPKEQYPEAKKYAENMAGNYREQADKYRAAGDFEKAEFLERKADVYRQISFDLQDSGISSKEAIFIREHPKLATAQYVMKTANSAGIESAKCAAVIAGSVSVAQNIVQVMKNEKEVDSAVLDVGKDVAASSATAYLIGVSDTAIRGFMGSSENSVFVNLSRSNVPAMIATTTVQVGKSLLRFAQGEIDSLQLVEELGEKGTGMMAASMGAAIGTAVLPGIGTVVGSMIGYMTSSTIYHSCMYVLNEERLSAERRNLIHQLAEAAVEAMNQQGKELLCLTEQFYGHRQEVFENCLSTMMECIECEDTERFTEALNAIVIEIGGKLQFKNFDEFDDFMSDPTSTFIF